MSTSSTHASLTLSSRFQEPSQFCVMARALSLALTRRTMCASSQMGIMAMDACQSTCSKQWLDSMICRAWQVPVSLDSLRLSRIRVHDFLCHLCIKEMQSKRTCLLCSLIQMDSQRFKSAATTSRNTPEANCIDIICLMTGSGKLNSTTCKLVISSYIPQQMRQWPIPEHH